MLIGLKWILTGRKVVLVIPSLAGLSLGASRTLLMIWHKRNHIRTILLLQLVIILLFTRCWYTFFFQWWPLIRAFQPMESTFLFILPFKFILHFLFIVDFSSCGRKKRLYLGLLVIAPHLVNRLVLTLLDYFNGGFDEHTRADRVYLSRFVIVRVSIRYNIYLRVLKVMTISQIVVSINLV